MPKGPPEIPTNYCKNNVCDIGNSSSQNLTNHEERGGFWSHVGESDLRKAGNPLGLSLFRDAFSRPSENVETMRETMFCDNAKVRWGNVINTVEMIHFDNESGKLSKKTNKTIRIFTIWQLHFVTFAKREKLLGI